MPISHVIVRGIKKFDQPIDLASVSPTGGPLDPLRVQFDDDQIAKLPRDAEFQRRQETLTQLHHAGLPAYVEVEPDSRIISTLLIPLQGHVVGLFRDASGDVTFQLDNSARPFTLKSSHPNYRDYVWVLQEAHIDGAPILVTESEPGSEIVDIRRVDPLEPALLLAAEMAPAPPPAAVRPVTQTLATEMFRLVASSSCDVSDVTGSCIPFLYPDDGCHARAHKMCSLIIDAHAGAQPRKVWNYGRSHTHPLVVKTPNVPACEELRWRFHVAVALEVQPTGAQEAQTLVLDPSLFPEGPVPVAIWQGAQGDPNSCLLYTSPDPFLPPVPEGIVVDPEDQKTDRELTRYRLKLKHRIAEDGPPPYKCPGNSTH